jgi:hypothetical protein
MKVIVFKRKCPQAPVLPLAQATRDSVTLHYFPLVYLYMYLKQCQSAVNARPLVSDQQLTEKKKNNVLHGQVFLPPSITGRTGA